MVLDFEICKFSNDSLSRVLKIMRTFLKYYEISFSENMSTNFHSGEIAQVL